MSKIGSFVGGFGVGMKMVNDAEDRKRRNEMEDRRFKIEMERAEREKARADEEDAYRRDLAAAGQTMTNGTSGVGGVATGSQQDAMLAQQNMRGEGGGSGGNQPVSGGFGIMRDAALRHGRVQDAHSFGSMADSERERERKLKYQQGNDELFKRHQAGEIDDTEMISSLADLKIKHGDPNNALDALLKSNDFRKRMQDENAEDAAKAFLSGAPAVEVANAFNKTGNVKFTEARYEEGKNFLGNPQRVLVAKLADGREVRYGEDQVLMMASKDVREYLRSMRNDATAADDKAAGRKHQTDTLNETRRHNMAMEGISRANAKAGSSGKGGPAFKDLSTDDYKSFTIYRDVIKPASGVGGKASVTKEAVIDQEALAKFRAWARAKGYNDMNLALRDWDAEGRPSSNAPAQPAPRKQAPDNRRPLSDIFR